MKTIKDPGIFLAQFLRDEEPFNNLGSISKWVTDLGYKGVQIPTWDTRVIDLSLGGALIKRPADWSNSTWERYRLRLANCLSRARLRSWLGVSLLRRPLYGLSLDLNCRRTGVPRSLNTLRKWLTR